MMWKIVAVLFGLFFLMMAVGGYKASTPEGRERAESRAMIDKCREAQNDELSDLATRRFMRQGCDEMEASFRRKWGVSP